MNGIEKSWSATFEPALVGAEAEAISASAQNLLVVSDLHIGETLGPHEPGYIKQIASLNHAFCRFLAYYAKERIGDRAWRLVIAGDMIDFLHASLTAHSAEFSGPNAAEAAAVEALERIVAHNRRVFRELAAFIATGNELVIIKGNHDAEFHWDQVQARFTSLLADIYAAEEARSASDVEAFRSRISICRWFYYERDLVYIEHGNQYDEWCSFEHVLSPEIPDDNLLEMPISHQTYRAFGGLLGTLNTHVVETWKLFDFVRWVLGLGPRVIGRLAYTYFGSVAWMYRTKAKLASATRKAGEAHLQRLRELTLRFRITEDVLKKLDDLRHRPAGKSVFSGGIRMLYMDHVALMILNLLVLFAMLVTPISLGLRASVAGGVVASSAIAALILSRYREVESHPKLLRMARKVGQLMKVPFVVFGHTHVPVFEALVEAGLPDVWYLNTGSFTAGGRRGLTHVCILRGPTGPSAELRRWDVKSQRPQPVHD